MKCLQFLFLLHVVALAHADRDTNANSDLAVQSSASFSKANATMEKASIMDLRQRPASNLQKTSHRHHHQGQNHRDHKTQMSPRKDQMQQIDDQPPPEPVDAQVPSEQYPPSAQSPSSHAHPVTEPLSLHDHSEQDYAHSQSNLENHMGEDVAPEEYADREPLEYGREHEGLQVFSRSRGREDAENMAAFEASSRAREDAAAMDAADDNEDFSQSDGQHEMHQRFQEPHGSAQESDIEDIQPRAEQENSGQLGARLAHETISQKQIQRSQEPHGFAQEDLVQDVQPRARKESFETEVAQSVHLAHQSPPAASSEAPQTFEKNVQMKLRPAPHFGNIDLNGDGFIDGLEFQGAVNRGDLR